MYESKESSVLKSIMDFFVVENMETQYHVLIYKIDLYFHDYKLAINGHKDRNEEHESQREKK